LKVFSALLKADLLRLFGINKAIKNGKGGKRIVTMTLVVVLVLLMIVVQSASVAAGIAGSLEPGEKYKAMSFALAAYVMIVLMMTVGTSKVLFGCSDYDMLMSLPVKTSIIVMSKIAYVYIVDLLFALAFIVPSAVICGVGDGMLAIYIVCSLIYCVFLPLLPMAVGLTVGTVVSYIVSRMRNKSLAGFIFSSLFVGVYLFMIFSSDGSDDSFISKIFAGGNLTFLWFIASGTAGNIAATGATVLVCAIVGALCVWIVSANFMRINQSIAARVAGHKFVMKEQSSGSMAKTLFVREFKLFFSSSTNVLNSLISPILAIAFAIMFTINGGVASIVGSFEGVDMEETIASFTEIFAAAMPYLPLFFISVCSYSSYAFSLEGKRLWAVKSLPIGAKDIFRAKLFLSVLIVLPFAFIATVIFGIGLKASVFDVALSCVIVCLYSLTGAAMGLKINLKHNFFDWRNEAEVVKRGASVFLCMLFGGLGMLALCVVQFILTALSNRYIGWAAAIVILVAAAATMIKTLFKNCEEKWLRLGEE